EGRGSAVARHGVGGAGGGAGAHPRARPAGGDRRPVGHDRLERPGEPHVLRRLRLPQPLRLPRGARRAAHARRPREGQGRGLDGHPRGDGARHRGHARLRALGHLPQGRL
ncbi:MAG: ATP-dependent Clp protease adaptor protein ClpS, partial [uncultured Quadrisphaera sp.]